jgi:hypothetical protein
MGMSGSSAAAVGEIFPLESLAMTKRPPGTVRSIAERRLLMSLIGRLIS